VRFNSDMVTNRWSISAKVLREFVDHFGPKTELLDIYSEDGRASFTSYTEKIMSGNGMNPSFGRRVFKSNKMKRY